jgi:hypothetical protein
MLEFGTGSQMSRCVRRSQQRLTIGGDRGTEMTMHSESEIMVTAERPSGRKPHAATLNGSIDTGQMIQEKDSLYCHEAICDGGDKTRACE